MHSLTCLLAMSRCPGRKPQKGEMVAGDFPVRRGGVNRGEVSVGSVRISSSGFPRTRPSSRHLSLARARRKFPLARARRDWLAKNSRIECASSYMLNGALIITRSREAKRRADPTRNRETTLRAIKHALYVVTSDTSR
jgi:hypothetical protein